MAVAIKNACAEVFMSIQAHSKELKINETSRINDGNSAIFVIITAKAKNKKKSVTKKRRQEKQEAYHW
jgi:hypothetical protein